MKRTFALSFLLSFAMAVTVFAADEQNSPAGNDNEQMIENMDFQLFAENINKDEIGKMPPPPQMMKGPFGEDKSKGKVMIIWKLTKDLNLDETTASKFFPIFNSYSEKRDKLTEKQRDLIMKVSVDVDNESVPTGTLKTKIKEINDIENSLIKEKSDFFKKAESVLDERQFMKLQIFEERLKMDIFERIHARKFMNKFGPEGDMDKKMDKGTEKN